MPVEEVFTVREEQISIAMRNLFDRLKLTVETSAAVPVAVVLFHHDFKRILHNVKTIGIILEGGNIDTGNYEKMKGLYEEGLKPVSKKSEAGSSKLADEKLSDKSKASPLGESSSEKKVEELSSEKLGEELEEMIEKVEKSIKENLPEVGEYERKETYLSKRGK